MSKNKRPSAENADELQTEDASMDANEALAKELCDLALAQRRAGDLRSSSAQPAAELERRIKKSLNQKNDDVLYESLECARLADDAAYQLLREHIEQAAESVRFHPDKGRSCEVDAFVIPLLIRSIGGLQRAQCFEDQEAFDALAASFKQAQLESPDATVVLISHAYHLDEIDGITYSQLHEMVRDAYTAMTAHKFVSTTSIERSLRGWPEPAFGPEDSAVELRFLLGFSLKATDDVFYRVPEDEAEADAYFDARARNFEKWADQVAPLVKRCLATDGRVRDVHFLYQDLFHGGKERGIAEFFMLQMMSQLNRDLEQHAIDPAGIHGVIGPVHLEDESILRVKLYGPEHAPISSVDKPIGFGRQLTLEIADAADALMTMGVEKIDVASGFDVNGEAMDLQPYQA
jgi:hypothetical protein